MNNKQFNLYQNSTSILLVYEYSLYMYLARP